GAKTRSLNASLGDKIYPLYNKVQATTPSLLLCLATLVIIADCSIFLLLCYLLLSQAQKKNIIGYDHLFNGLLFAINKEGDLQILFHFQSVKIHPRKRVYIECLYEIEIIKR
ncbi:hypothetical protein ACJX0J_034024, partial [Zea mays]